MAPGEEGGKEGKSHLTLTCIADYQVVPINITASFCACQSPPEGKMKQGVSRFPSKHTADTGWDFTVAEAQWMVCLHMFFSNLFLDGIMILSRR